jgi:Sulfatase-modifying factor enzyme 1
MENIRSALSQAADLGERELREIMQDERTRRAIIAHISQAENERLDHWLAFVRTFPAEMQREIFDDERARRAIVEHFEERVFAAFDPARRRYDFAAAQRQVNTLESLYPDSAAALKIRTELDARRDNALDRLSERFNRYLEAGLLVPDQSRQYIGDVLDAVRRMAPTHHLLNDDRLRLRYGELAETARRAGDFDRAAALVRAGLDYAPGDPVLIDLRYQVQSELARAANQRRVADVERRLSTRVAQLHSVADFAPWRDDLLLLTELDPGSPTLARARTRLEQLLGDDLARLNGRPATDPEWDRSWRDLLQNAPLLGLDFVRAARQQLPDRASLDAAEAESPSGDARIEKQVDDIAALLAHPRAELAWRSLLERAYKELVIMLPSEHALVREQRERIAEHFLTEARRARRSASFNEALSFIEAGRVFHPGFPPFDMETLAVSEAQAELRARRENERREALVDSLKADFLGKAETNQVQEAKSILQELRAQGLADSDAFLREEAPRALADAYARLAATRATRQDYANAASLARAGLDHWPQHTELRARLAEYEIALENQRFENALRARLSDPQPLDVPATATDLARLQARHPNRFSDMAAELAALRTAAVLERARAVQPIGDRMAEQLAAFDALFPARRGRLAPLLAEVVEKRIRNLRPANAADVEALHEVIDNVAALAPVERSRLRTALAETIAASARARAAEDPQAARSMLAAARTVLAQQPSLVEAARALPLPELDAARASLEAGALSAAARELDAAAQRDPEHPDITALRLELENAMQESQSAYASYVDDIAAADVREQQQFDDRHARIVAAWRDNPNFHRLRIHGPRKGECNNTLAGYGAQAGGTCYDMVAGRKGPEMVVVPAGDGLDKAYAIGKYEVSVFEFNYFCEQSHRCNAHAGAERRLPVTNVSVADAEEYARWLSEEASRQNGHRVLYRLPTASEWHHAAMADGQQPEQQFNCRVLSAGEVIAGHALINARSGQQNGWGLANYAGNARELVRNGQSLAVRGGAYNDPLTECGPELDERHSGEADPLTGFRLVRELG